MSHPLDSNAYFEVRGGLDRLLTPEPEQQALSLTLAEKTTDSAEKPLMRLSCERVLRFLPERRLVCLAQLDGVFVVVKWFFGDNAARYQLREFKGCQELLNSGLPTPSVLHAFRFATPEDQPAPVAGYALIFEYLTDAELLSDSQLQASPALFTELWGLLARMHSAGVVHEDLHFGNLMCRGTKLWLIDGDAVRRRRPEPLGRVQSVQGFVGLAAQTQKALSHETLLSFWQVYREARARGSAFEAVADSAVWRGYRRARRMRIHHYQAKTQRTCSDFESRRTVLGSVLLERAWLQSRAQAEVRSEAQIGRALLSWLDALPALMEERDGRAGERQAGEALKRGNTATVVAASFEGYPLIVKRYNNKSALHRLRRMLVTNRGLNSWVFGHTLAFMGIASAVPVALLRTRFGGPTYLIMRQLRGETLSPERFDTAPGRDGFELVARKLCDLLGQLAAEGLVHGDTKASNFVWDPAGQTLHLIDLDSMRMPATRRARLHGQDIDRRRLLRNFAQAPDLQRSLGSMLHNPD